MMEVVKAAIEHMAHQIQQFQKQSQLSSHHSSLITQQGNATISSQDPIVSSPASTTINPPTGQNPNTTNFCKFRNYMKRVLQPLHPNLLP